MTIHAFWLPSGPYFFISHEWKWVGNNKAANICFGRGVHLYWEVVQGCAMVMTPFFQASRHFLAYQVTLNAPFMCPAFSIFRKIMDFKLVLAKIPALKMQIFQIFVPKSPHFSRKIHSLDPTFENLCGTNPPKKKKKKVECPSPPQTCFRAWPLLHLMSFMYTC